MTDRPEEPPEALASRRAREAREAARLREPEAPPPRRISRRGVVGAVLLGLGAIRMLERGTAGLRRP